MARYTPNIASAAKTVEELRRSQTRENRSISVAVSDNDRNINGILDAIEAATDLDDLKVRIRALRV